MIATLTEVAIVPWRVEAAAEPEGAVEAEAAAEVDETWRLEWESPRAFETKTRTLQSSLDPSALMVEDQYQSYSRLCSRRDLLGLG